MGRKTLTQSSAKGSEVPRLATGCVMSVVQKRCSYDRSADARTSCNPGRTRRGKDSSQGSAGSGAMLSVFSGGRRSDHAASRAVDFAASVSFRAKILVLLSFLK